MSEYMSMRDRLVWIGRVWKRARNVVTSEVARFPVRTKLLYVWRCVRVTAALLLNNEVEPTTYEEFDTDLVMAYGSRGTYETDHGVGCSWDYIQLSGWLSFIYGSDGDL